MLGWNHRNTFLHGEYAIYTDRCVSAYFSIVKGPFASLPLPSSLQIHGKRMQWCKEEGFEITWPLDSDSNFAFYYLYDLDLSLSNQYPLLQNARKIH